MNKYLVALLALMLAPSVSFAGGKLSRNPLKKVPVYQKVNIDENRLVVLKGPVNSFSVDPLVRKITELDRIGKSPIYLIINSPGGSVTDGFELIGAITSIESPVVCIAESEAYSMAALISVFCDKLYMHRFSMMMFHEASWGGRGDETKMKARGHATAKYLDQVFNEVAEELGLTLKQFREKIHPEWWLTAREAVQVGIADGIVKELNYKYDPPQRQFFFSLFEDDEEDKYFRGLNFTAGPKFKAGDRVRITKEGFYRGCTGTVNIYPFRTYNKVYRYALSHFECQGFNSNISGLIPESDLELVKKK